MLMRIRHEPFETHLVTIQAVRIAKNVTVLDVLQRHLIEPIAQRRKRVRSASYKRTVRPTPNTPSASIARRKHAIVPQ